MAVIRVGPASVAWVPARPPVVLDALAVLSGPDLLRAAAMASDQLNRFLRGRLLVNSLVAELFPDATGWVVSSSVCQRCGKLHAGVGVEGVLARASVAYAPDLVVATVAPSCLVGRLGVDVEAADVDQERALELRRMLGASSEPVLRRWTRVGAVLKADGRGLLVDPGAVHLRRGGAWLAGEHTSYEVAEVDGPSGYLISLAWCAAGSTGTDPGQTSSRMTGPAGTRWSTSHGANLSRSGRRSGGRR